MRSLVKVAYAIITTCLAMAISLTGQTAQAGPSEVSTSAIKYSKAQLDAAKAGQLNPEMKGKTQAQRLAAAKEFTKKNGGGAQILKNSSNSTRQIRVYRDNGCVSFARSKMLPPGTFAPWAVDSFQQGANRKVTQSYWGITTYTGPRTVKCVPVYLSPTTTLSVFYWTS